MVMGVILLSMYFAKILTNFKENLENIQYISFFHYLDADKILVKGEVEIFAVGVLIGVSVVTTVIGAFYFNKRDIAV